MTQARIVRAVVNVREVVSPWPLPAWASWGKPKVLPMTLARIVRAVVNVREVVSPWPLPAWAS